MKMLIADDELNNRILLKKILSEYGECDFVVNGEEAVEAFELALQDRRPYHLVCLDIMMPVMDGQTALVRLRDLEEAYGVTGQQACTIFMVSALDTEQQIVKAFFRGGCTDFLTKPVTRARVQAKLREYGLIAPPSGGATA